MAEIITEGNLDAKYESLFPDIVESTEETPGVEPDWKRKKRARIAANEEERKRDQEAIDAWWNKYDEQPQGGESSRMYPGIPDVSGGSGMDFSMNVPEMSTIGGGSPMNLGVNNTWNPRFTDWGPIQNPLSNYRGGAPSTFGGVPTFMPAGQGPGSMMTPQQMLDYKLKMSQLGLQGSNQDFQNMLGLINARTKLFGTSGNLGLGAGNIAGNLMSNVVSPFYLSAMKMPTAANKARARGYF